MNSGHARRSCLLVMHADPLVRTGLAAALRDHPAFDVHVNVGGPLSELVDGVRAVTDGVRYMSPSAAHRIADSLAHTALTSRELEVLRLVARGESNKVIAQELDIEVGTVKSHVSAIMGKLGARSRTQAASIAVARGLVDAPHARMYVN